MILIKNFISIVKVLRSTTLLILLTQIHQINASELIFYASISDNAELVVKAIEEGANVNAIKQKERHKGQTPLCLAAQFASVHATEALIKNSHIDLNKANQYGDTPLMLAVRDISDAQDRIKITEMLIKNGADIDAVNSEGVSTLMRARDPKIALILIKNGAYFDSVYSKFLIFSNSKAATFFTKRGIFSQKEVKKLIAARPSLGKQHSCLYKKHQHLARKFLDPLFPVGPKSVIWSYIYGKTEEKKEYQRTIKKRKLNLRASSNPHKSNKPLSKILNFFKKL